jgi:Bax inhibitor 1 like
MLLRTGNPTLTEDTFRSYVRVRGQAVMTLDGTVHKTGISLLILMVAAGLGWNRMLGPIVPVMWTGLGCGALLGLVTTFKRDWAPWTTPAYAAFEGVLLGSDAVQRAVSGHRRERNVADGRRAGGDVAAIPRGSGAWKRELSDWSDRRDSGDRAGVLVSIGLSFFGKSIPLIHQSGPIGIAFSLVVVVIAARQGTGAQKAVADRGRSIQGGTGASRLRVLQGGSDGQCRCLAATTRPRRIEAGAEGV